MRAGFSGIALLFLAACQTAPVLELLSTEAPLADGGALIVVDGGVVAPPRDGSVIVRPDAGRPPDAGAPFDSGAIGLDDGDPCTEDRQCQGGRCLPHPTYPGGYCTKERCRSDGDCASTSACYHAAGPDFCARSCDALHPCREGYACTTRANGLPDVCLPGTPITMLPDGAACSMDRECRGGSCLRPPDWPGGYCTERGCDPESSLCASGNHPSICAPVDFSFEPMCAQSCTGPADCRTGYTCRPIDVAVRVCLPDVANPPVLEPPASYPFSLRCGLAAANGRVTIDYTIAPSTTAYMITPIARDGRWLLPLEVRLPGGGRIDYAGANAFQTTMALIHGWVSPMIVPAASQFAGHVMPGAHQLVLETSSTDVCWYLLEESSAGTEIDLDLYYVGVPGLTAATAPNHPDVSTFIERIGDVYAAAGVGVGTVRHHDITGANAMRFAIIREHDDVLELVALSQRPSGGLDGSLTVNIFIIQAFGGETGLLGVSSGLPGAAALHATQASGVVVSAEFFGQQVPDPFTGMPVDGAAFTGVTAAHEVGHFLGLFHTTESDGLHFDPVLDTPECSPDRFPVECDDLLNLMFPFATGASVLSEGQAAMMHANPLTKE